MLVKAHVIGWVAFTSLCSASFVSNQHLLRKHTLSGNMSARTDVEAEQNQASSGITPEALESTLKNKLDASHVDIQDLSGMDDIAPNRRNDADDV